MAVGVGETERPWKTYV